MKDRNLEKELNNLEVNQKLNDKFSEDLWSDLSEKYNKFNYLNSVMDKPNAKKRNPLFMKRNWLTVALTVFVVFTVFTVPTYSYFKVPTFQEAVNNIFNIIPEGTVVINSMPEGADAYINGEYKGVTPLTIDLPEGNYSLFLMKGDEGSTYETFSVEGNSVTNVNASLYLEGYPDSPYANWFTYSNDRFGSGLSLKYPGDWEISEDSETGLLSTGGVNDVDYTGVLAVVLEKGDFTVSVNMHWTEDSDTDVYLSERELEFYEENGYIKSAQRYLDVLPVSGSGNEGREIIGVYFNIENGLGVAEDSEEWNTVKMIMESVGYLHIFEPSEVTEVDSDDDYANAPGMDENILKSDDPKFIARVRDLGNGNEYNMIQDIYGLDGDLYDPWDSWEYAVTNNMVIYNTGEFLMTAGTGETKAPMYLAESGSQGSVKVSFSRMELSPDGNNLLVFISIYDSSKNVYIDSASGYYSGLNMINLSTREIEPIYKVKESENLWFRINFGWAADSSSMFITHIKERTFDVYPVISDTGTCDSDVYVRYSPDITPSSFGVNMIDSNTVVIRSYNIVDGRYWASTFMGDLNCEDGSIVNVREFELSDSYANGPIVISPSGKYLVIDRSNILYNLEDGTETRLAYDNNLTPHSVKFIDDNVLVARFCNDDTCSVVGVYDVEAKEFLVATDWSSRGSVTVPKLY